MTEQDDDLADALAYLQDMQNSNDRMAKIQWSWWINKLIKNAFKLLKKFINRYPLVKQYGKKLFC